MAVAAEGRPVEDPSVSAQVDGGSEERHPAPRMGFGVATQEDVAQIPVAVDPPWLTIIHPISELGMSGKFIPGSLVLGKEYLVAKAGEHITCVVWDYRTYFKEYLNQEQRNAKQRPRTFFTAAEAHAAGLTTETNPITRALPTAPMAMTWVMLIEKPAGLACDLFCVDVAGKSYAPALFGVDKSAFLSVKNPFFMAAQFTTKPFGGVKAMRWDLWTRIYEAKTGNKTWVPSLRPVGIMPEDERKAFSETASAFGGKPAGEEGPF